MCLFSAVKFKGDYFAKLVYRFSIPFGLYVHSTADIFVFVLKVETYFGNENR